MEIASAKAGLSLKKNNRSSNSKLLGFNLSTLIASLKRSCAWSKGELNSLILLKSPGKQVILTAMREGTEIESFQSNDSISFQIMEGNLRFHLRKDIMTLTEGQVMTLDEKIKYHIIAREDTVFLLTITDN
jgi:hypothetical protein